jgi:uncharacterized membrane protein
MTNLHAKPKSKEGIELPGAVRYERLDALRGLAMVWMTAYHFAFDLNHFKYITQNFYTDPVWTWQRSAIVSLFLFCAGASQAVAMHQGQSWPRFWRRWAQIAACALLVSLGSYFMFPQSWIYFGVLHGIAAMLVLLRLLAPLGQRLWWVGAAAFALWFWGPGVLLWCAGEEFAPLLNSKPLNWLGLITRKPITEDYVPILPWLGVVCWGFVAAQWLLAHKPQTLTGSAAAARPLTLLGQWSLSYYMLHQPVLIGLLAAVIWLSR